MEKQQASLISEPPVKDKERLIELLLDQEWRLNNLYRIRDAEGKSIPFVLNWAQKDFLDNMHYFNVILKARQLGFSTFILIYLLDACLFNSNHQCGVIAHGLEEAKDLFKNKIKFAYDNIPKWLKNIRSVKTDSARRLEFEHGEKGSSDIVVGTSLRGGTFQKLHVSEYGKIAARYPEKAREIKTGAFNTVHSGQQIFVESTAEGQSGEFYDLVQLSRQLEEEGRDLTPLDPKFHFYPWWKHPDYKLSDNEAETTILTSNDVEYFNKLNLPLTLNQKAWYVKKARLMGDDMKREYPATPEEAFESSLEGAYYQKEMSYIRKNRQICRVPWEPSLPVHTFWDLGLNDDMAIWFFQHVGMEYRFLRYYANSGEGIGFYATKLIEFGYTYGDHYMPHDGEIRRLGKETHSVQQIAESLGIRPVEIVKRTNSVQVDIQAIRLILPRCWFDEENCAEGIRGLDNYRKEWDDKRGVWKSKPRHDDASHPADSFRTFGVGYEGRKEELQYEDDDDYNDSSLMDEGRDLISGY